MGADFTPAGAAALTNEGATKITQGLIDLECFHALRPLCNEGRQEQPRLGKEADFDFLFRFWYSAKQS